MIDLERRTVESQAWLNLKVEFLTKIGEGHGSLVWVADEEDIGSVNGIAQGVFDAEMGQHTVPDGGLLIGRKRQHVKGLIGS